MAATRRARPVLTETGSTGCYDVSINHQRIGFVVRDTDRSWASYTWVDGYPEPIGRHATRREAAAALRDRWGTTTDPGHSPELAEGNAQ